MIGTQTPQAVLRGLANIVGFTALLAFPHLHPELSGDQYLVAAPFESTAQVFFTLPATVDIGGIEKVNAGIDCCVDHSRGSGGVDTPAKVVTSQSSERNFQRSNFSFF